MSARIRMEGKLEVLDRACSSASLALGALERGELVNLHDAVRALQSDATCEAVRAAIPFADDVEVRARVAQLETLRVALPSLIRQRARTLLLPEGDVEALATRLVADPILHFTSLEDPPPGVRGARLLLTLLATALVSTQAALFMDFVPFALSLALVTAAVAFIFLKTETDLFRPVRLIMTRSRLIVGGQALPLATIRTVSIHSHMLTTLELLNHDGSRIVFVKRPPAWLETELRVRGVHCQELWRGFEVRTKNR